MPLKRRRRRRRKRRRRREERAASLSLLDLIFFSFVTREVNKHNSHSLFASRSLLDSPFLLLFSFPPSPSTSPWPLPPRAPCAALRAPPATALLVSLLKERREKIAAFFFYFVSFSLALLLSVSSHLRSQFPPPSQPSQPSTARPVARVVARASSKNDEQVSF